MIPVLETCIDDAIALLILTARDGNFGLFRTDGASSTLDRVADLPAGIEAMAAEPVAGDLRGDDARYPCLDVAFAYRGTSEVLLVAACDRDRETGQVRWRDSAEITRLMLEAPAVDGAFAGRIGTGRHLELMSGPHLVSVAKNGRKVVRVETELGPGERRAIDAKLEWTGQRRAAMALFVTSAAALGGGMFLSALAIREENQAEGILGRKAASNISPADLRDYDDAIRARDQFRAAAVASFAASAGALATGAVLFAFDKPDLKEVLPQRSNDRKKPDFEVGIVTAHGAFGPSVRVGF